MAMVMMMAMVTAMAMVTVMSKTVAMMAVRNGGDALGYGDDDGNDATAVRLMTAMMAMTLWKRTFPYLHACRYGKGSGDTAKRNKLATLGSSSTVGENGDEVTGSCLELSPPLSSRYLTDRPVLDDRVRV